jgi:hypothetical protein
MLARVKSSKTHSQDKSTHQYFVFHISLGKVHRPAGAELLTESASTLHKMKASIFINGVLQRNGLGVKNVGGFPEPESQVEGIGYFDFTFFGTQATGNTLFGINVAGPLLQLHLKSARLPHEPGHFRQGVELDIAVPADLDQLGSQNSHSAVVGGKGLIQLRHGPADGGLFFHQIYKIAGVGQIQGGLHSGDTAAHYHYRSEHLSVHKAPL